MAIKLLFDDDYRSCLQDVSLYNKKLRDLLSTMEKVETKVMMILFYITVRNLMDQGAFRYKDSCDKIIIFLPAHVSHELKAALLKEDILKNSKVLNLTIARFCKKI